MATMQQLKGQVLAFISQAEPQTDDGVAVRYNVETFLREALHELLLTAPAHLLPVRSFADVAPTINADGSGSIALPSDFLRLVEFMIHGWMRSVTAPINELSGLYSRQHNPITRGTPEAPIVVVFSNEVPERTLHYFSLPADQSHVIALARYVPLVDPTAIPEPMATALCWLTAYNVLAVNGENEAATFARSRYEQSITINYGAVTDRDK